MSADWMRSAIERVATVIIDHADELTALDAAIGDGDHGHNMRRGAEAVRADADAIAAMAPGDALKKIGMTLVSKVGGASGPLYGSLFMDAGKALNGAVDLHSLTAAVEAGIAGVKRRGKAEPGQKTMLDVWVPVLEALKEADDPHAATDAVRGTAVSSCAATDRLKATKGRAAYLGDRSVGHVDPGARSSALILVTLCDLFEEKTA